MWKVRTFTTDLTLDDLNQRQIWTEDSYMSNYIKNKLTRDSEMLNAHKH